MVKARLVLDIALFLPVAIPVPIIAVPFSDITALTSAKSTLTCPLCIIISEIPCTAPFKTSSDFAKASEKFEKILGNAVVSLTRGKPNYWKEIYEKYEKWLQIPTAYK